MDPRERNEPTWLCTRLLLQQNIRIFTHEFALFAVSLTIEVHIHVKARLPNGGDENTEAEAIAKGPHRHHHTNKHIIGCELCHDLELVLRNVEESHRRSRYVVEQYMRQMVGEVFEC